MNKYNDLYNCRFFKGLSKWRKIYYHYDFTVLGLVALLLIVFKDDIAEVLGRNVSTGVLIPLRLTAVI